MSDLKGSKSGTPNFSPMQNVHADSALASWVIPKTGADLAENSFILFAPQFRDEAAPWGELAYHAFGSSER
jgi:hypothetical protein